MTRELKLTIAERKLLRNYVKLLPSIMQETHEVHRMTGAEVLEFGYVCDEKEVKPTKHYNIKMPVLLDVNHYTRIKKAYIKTGIPGITEYLKWVKKLHDEQKTENEVSN